MKFYKYIAFGAVLLAFGCTDYLDISPDKSQELDLAFERKDKAYNALATCYHYIPKYDAVFSSYIMATDELTAPYAHNVDGIELMRGNQRVDEPLMSFWSGYNSAADGQTSLWQAIRDCNIMIENIDHVIDMTTDEKNQWKAEAQFLKAYYHFLLLQMYGPIPIVDENLPLSASVEDVRVKRQPFDECVDYITNTIDKAVPFLPERVISRNDLGRVDQLIAKSLKSRVLLFAASPLNNGNVEFYSSFVDKDGNNLYNLTPDKEKWKKAADAAKAAIDQAETMGVHLYEYTGSPLAQDTTLFETVDEIKALYNYRYMFTEKWNSELIWGYSNPLIGGSQWWMIQAACLMKNPDVTQNEAAWQWIAPSLKMVETYYTANGLPIDEDLSFDYEGRYRLYPIREADQYHAQQGEQTMKLHLNREPRFYASIGFDRGFNRTWGKIFDLHMRYGEDHGKKNESNDNLLTGYALKKLVHMDSEGTSYDNMITNSWPLIRLAELYLNYAEAYNEYYGPGAEVYKYLDQLRARSGVPSVEDAWSDPEIAKTLNKHLDKDGLREIIHQERMIELAFEGHRYRDIRRWKKAQEYFSVPVQGLSINEDDPNYFYTVKDISQRSFITPRDYLQPIKLEELNVNSNLVQNPGW